MDGLARPDVMRRFGEDVSAIRLSSDRDISLAVRAMRTDAVGFPGSDTVDARLRGPVARMPEPVAPHTLRAKRAQRPPPARRAGRMAAVDSRGSGRRGRDQFFGAAGETKP